MRRLCGHCLAFFTCPGEMASPNQAPICRETFISLGGSTAYHPAAQLQAPASVQGAETAADRGLPRATTGLAHTG